MKQNANPYLIVLQHELLLAWRRPGQFLNPLLYYIIVIVLFALAVGADPTVLKTFAPGILWVAALLATLLGLDALFHADFADGSLTMLALSPHSWLGLISSKLFAHWLLLGLPLILLTPLMSIWLNLPNQVLGILLLTMLLGTPILLLLGAIGAALTLNAHSNQALLALVVLPLYVPVIIIATGVVTAALQNLPVVGPLYILAALTLLTLTLAPWAIAAAVKTALSA